MAPRKKKELPRIEWAASVIEPRPLAALIPYARNARTHTDAQVAQIAASMTQFGWTVPVLVDEQDGIIAGHGRVLAAQLLRVADAPVIVARGWSEEKRRAYVLADNKLALNSDWDKALLSSELSDLRDDGVDLAALGFGDEELADLLPEPADLMDPMDGASSTRSDNGAALSWGKNRVPLSPEEVLWLNSRLAEHQKNSGVSFGFVREVFAGGDLQS